MGIIIDDIQDTLLLDISSLEGTVNVFSKPNVYSLKVSPDVIVPKATNTTYGVIKGSDSILINNGTPVINPDYLQGYLSLSLGPYFDDYSSESILPYVDSKISDFISTIDESYLSKIKADTAKAPITFQDTAKIDKELIFGTYAPGMLVGNGGRIDEEGNAELESLVVRSFLEVPELRHNRETIMGMEMTIGDSGIISKVTPTVDPDMFILTMKLEEGELISFWEHDIVKGIFNYGNGFFTSWFRINSIDQEAQTMLITMASPEVLSSGRNFPPKPFMHIAHRGNFIHTERQTVIFLTAYEKKIIILSHVDNYEGGLITAQLGVPTGLESVLGEVPADVSQPYLFAKGILVQDIIRVNYLGQILKEVIDRGTWSLAIAQSDDPYLNTSTVVHEVWHDLNKYRCIVSNTLDTPSIGSPDWILIVGFKDEFEELENKIPISWELKPVADEGLNVFNYNEEGIINTLTYRVLFYRSGIDVTDIMQVSTKNLYNFERKNMFGVDDLGVTDISWNLTHSGHKVVTLTDSDIYGVGELIVAFDEALVEAEYQILK